MSEDTSKPDEGTDEIIAESAGQGDAAAQEDIESSRMYPPPANFRLFLESLLSQAWLALGKFPNPMTGEQKFDEPWARYYIDMVGMLAEKTAGNLDKDEAQLMEINLSSLRLTFVEEQKSQKSIPDASTPDASTPEANAEEG